MLEILVLTLIIAASVTSCQPADITDEQVTKIQEYSAQYEDIQELTEEYKEDGKISKFELSKIMTRIKEKERQKTMEEL